MEDVNIVVGDIHLGRNSNNLTTFLYTERFLNEQIYTECENLDISGTRFSVTLMGDTFHSESLISSYIASRMSRFIKKLSSLNNCMSIIILVGNHDTWTKDSNDENASNIFMSNHKVNIVYDYQVLTTPSGRTCMMVSHCADESKFLEFIRSDNSDYLFMHQEILGFLYKGEDSISTITPDLLSSYKSVYNGHIHSPSRSGNITITGSIEQNGFGEDNNITGFFVVQMSNFSDVFIINSISPTYSRIKYDDIKLKNDKELEDMFYKKYIRIYCNSEEDHYDCQFLIRNVESAMSIKPIKVTEAVITESMVEEHELRSISENIEDTAFKLVDSLKGKEFKGFKVNSSIIATTKLKIKNYHEKLN